MLSLVTRLLTTNPHMVQGRNGNSFRYIKFHRVSHPMATINLTPNTGLDVVPARILRWPSGGAESYALIPLLDVQHTDHEMRFRQKNIGQSINVLMRREHASASLFGFS